MQVDFENAKKQMPITPFAAIQHLTTNDGKELYTVIPADPLEMLAAMKVDIMGGSASYCPCFKHVKAVIVKGMDTLDEVQEMGTELAAETAASIPEVPALLEGLVEDDVALKLNELDGIMLTDEELDELQDAAQTTADELDAMVQQISIRFSEAFGKHMRKYPAAD